MGRRAAPTHTPLWISLLLATTALGQAPNDPLYPSQEQLQAPICDVEGAWLTTGGDPSVVIAVIDSGVDYGHEDTIRQFYLNQVEVGAEFVADRNGNGVIDRQDLTLVGAGNGIDDDGNGYVDDFSGYDFDDDDNDENDATQFGHGQGRCGVVAAQGNNGIGIAGVCPQCRVMGVRAGDTFVVSAHDLARGLVFAVDAGAQVVNMALGALGNSRMLRDAMAYGSAQQVVYCVSIGNQWRYHHHWPATYDDVIAMSALDPVTSEGPWAARANYSNFGAHNVLASPSDTLTTYYGGGYGLTSGTSTASPHCSGIAGLLLARAHTLDSDNDLTNDVFGLTANEVKQLMVETATDIVGGEDRSSPGWDLYSGYGRLNARRAVDRVTSATIPPEANLDRPRAYAYLDPAVNSQVDVTGQATARRAASGTYQLELGVGVEPSNWQPVGSGSLPTIGTLGTLDLSAIPHDPSAPVTGPDAFTVTLRLSVDDTLGNHGEDRRALFVRRDETLRAGFPIDLESSVEGSPLVVDVDRDGRLDIVLATADGEVVVVDRDAHPLPGWPATTTPPRAYSGSVGYASGAVRPTYGSIVGSPSAADLDGDCRIEIVVTTMEGFVEVFNSDGSRAMAVSSQTGEGFATAPALADLDGDGALEIVASCLDQRMYAFHRDGTLVNGWPVLLQDPSRPTPDHGPSLSSPAIGDIDGDGSPEIVLGSGEVYDGPNPDAGYGRVYAFHADGSTVSGWPIGGRDVLDLIILIKNIDAVLPVLGEGVGSSPVLVDLDGDGRLEILFGTPTGPVYVYSGSGVRLSLMEAAGGGPQSDATQPSTVFALGSPVVADLDGDGGLDLISPTITADLNALQSGASFRQNLEFSVSAWSLANGGWLDGFPKVVDDWSVLTSLAVADVDGDGTQEVITPSAGYLLHALSADGSEPAGWPKLTGGWITTPTIADLDGDGGVDILATTREGLLFVWHGNGTIATDPTVAGVEPAIRFHHDARSSGNAHLDAEPPAPIADLRAVRHETQIHLSWTATGDDDERGRASVYSVRSSTVPFDCDNWARAVSVGAVPPPQSGGSREQFAFMGPLADSARFVGVRPSDESGNRPPPQVVEVIDTIAPLLRAEIPTGVPMAMALPLDLARDLYDANAQSPYWVDNESGSAGVIVYHAPDSQRLVAIRVLDGVDLHF